MSTPLAPTTIDGFRQFWKLQSRADDRQWQETICKAATTKRDLGRHQFRFRFNKVRTETNCRPTVELTGRRRATEQPSKNQV